MSSNPKPRKTTLPDRRALLARPTPKPPLKPIDRRPYWMGMLGSVLAGVLGALMFNRAAQDAARGRKIAPLGRMQVFSLVLTVVGVLRQLAEIARPPKPATKKPTRKPRR
jgi:hypothetical protein